MANEKFLKDCRLNATDVIILNQLLLFGRLTIEQLSLLLRREGAIRKEQTIEKRLSALRRWGFIQSSSPLRANGSRYPCLFFLYDDKRTKQLLEFMFKEPIPSEVWGRAVEHSRKIEHGRAMETFARRYTHDKVVKDFLLGIELGDGATMNVWNTPTYTFKYSNRNYRIEPDLFLDIQVNTYPYPDQYYYIESEQTRKKKAFIEHRIDNYLALLRSKEYQKSLPYFPTILFIFAPEVESSMTVYAKTIRRALFRLEKDSQKWGRVIRFGSTTADKVSLSEEGFDVNAGLWVDLTDTPLVAKYSLVDLVPGSVRDAYLKAT